MVEYLRGLFRRNKRNKEIPLVIPNLNEQVGRLLTIDGEERNGVILAHDYFPEELPENWLETGINELPRITLGKRDLIRIIIEKREFGTEIDIEFHDRTKKTERTVTHRFHLNDLTQFTHSEIGNPKTEKKLKATQTEVNFLEDTLTAFEEKFNVGEVSVYNTYS